MAIMGVDLTGQVILRWDSASDCAALVEPGGIDAVWLQNASPSPAGVSVLAPDAIRLLTLDQAGGAQPGVTAAVRAGVWPGAQAASRGGGAVVAGATARAWVDSNAYLIPYLRALYPGQARMLAYLPDKEAGIADGRVIAYDSLELALAEAWCAGSGCILAPDAACRDALLAGNTTALTAWKRMGRTARWLKQNRALFRPQPPGGITVLVEPGEATAEIANLMYRHSGSPDLVAASRLPAPDPSRRPILVAAGIHAVPANLGKALVAHARAGATVVTDACDEPVWWRVPGLTPARKFEDREFYTLGRGRIVAYKEVVTDPGDFSLDVLDLAGDRRPVRMWDLSAGIASVSGVSAREAIVRVVNYGSGTRGGVLVHVLGGYTSANLLRPESEPLALRTYRRGANTEVMLPAITRLAVVVFGG